MRALRPILACLIGAACATARPRPTDGGLRAYPATDARIRVMGRHVDDGNAVTFGASGVTFVVRFRGPALDAALDEMPHDSTGHDWFTVVVDDDAPTRFQVDQQTHRYTLVRDLAPGVHTLALSKATEGQNGHERLVALYATELLPVAPLPARRIEYIGNSITAGYGLDPRPVACGAGTWYDQTHAWLAYGPRVARRVHAQWMLSAISGIGMLRNWNSPGPVMPDVYRGVYMEYADSTTSWDFRRYTPDLVIVALGTNDFSDGGGPTPRPPLDGDAFVRAYTRFLAGVRARDPRARVLLLNSPMLDAARKARLTEYLDRVIAERAAAGDPGITQFAFAGRYVAGCNGHPSLDEQARMAEELEPVVRRTMGW